MTNKQYEHLGRAMMAAADLAQGVDGLRDLRNAFEGELSILVGRDVAETVAQKIMTDNLPTYRLGDVIIGIAKAVAEEKQ